MKIPARQYVAGMAIILSVIHFIVCADLLTGPVNMKQPLFPTCHG